MGRPGIAATAISAVDAALWDLKARLLEIPLCTLLGATRDAVPIYGSGGFTSYSPARLEEQLGGWAAAGITRVKMKVGRELVAAFQARADLDRRPHALGREHVPVGVCMPPKFHVLRHHASRRSHWQNRNGVLKTLTERGCGHSWANLRSASSTRRGFGISGALTRPTGYVTFRTRYCGHLD
jgi:hypothetical protein